MKRKGHLGVLYFFFWDSIMIRQAYERLIGIDKKAVEERRKICAACPSQKNVHGILKCDKCGCIIYVKSAIGASHCPLNKW